MMSKSKHAFVFVLTSFGLVMVGVIALVLCFDVNTLTSVSIHPFIRLSKDDFLQYTTTQMSIDLSHNCQQRAQYYISNLIDNWSSYHFYEKSYHFLIESTLSPQNSNNINPQATAKKFYIVNKAIANKSILLIGDSTMQLLYDIFVSFECQFDLQSFTNHVIQQNWVTPYKIALNLTQLQSNPKTFTYINSNINRTMKVSDVNNMSNHDQEKRKQSIFTYGMIDDAHDNILISYCPNYNTTIIMKKVKDKYQSIFNSKQTILEQQIRYHLKVFGKNISINITPNIDITIFNMGLHLLHNYNPQENVFYGGDTVDATDLVLGNNYEKLMKSVIKQTSDLGCKRMIFVTTNPICEENFRDSWISLADYYGSRIMDDDYSTHEIQLDRELQPNLFKDMVACANSLNQHFRQLYGTSKLKSRSHNYKQHTVDVDHDENIDININIPNRLRFTPQLCYDYQFTNRGVRKVNNRMRNFVKKYHNCKFKSSQMFGDTHVHVRRLSVEDEIGHKVHVFSDNKAPTTKYVKNVSNKKRGAVRLDNYNIRKYQNDSDRARHELILDQTFDKLIDTNINIDSDIYLFDSYNLFVDRCRWSPILDGRHYKKIKYIQLLALFQLLSKSQECINVPIVK